MNIWCNYLLTFRLFYKMSPLFPDSMVPYAVETIRTLKKELRGFGSSRLSTINLLWDIVQDI